MLTLLLAAAGPSKVPFYVVGGILALWAVVLAATGLRYPDFPFGATGQRLVVLVSLALAAGTVAAAVSTA